MDRLSDIIKMSCSCVVFVDVCVACVCVCVCFGVGKLGVVVLLPCIRAANCQGHCPSSECKCFALSQSFREDTQPWTCICLREEYFAREIL